MNKESEKNWLNKTLGERPELDMNNRDRLITVTKHYLNTFSKQIPLGSFITDVLQINSNIQHEREHKFILLLLREIEEKLHKMNIDIRSDTIDLLINDKSIDLISSGIEMSARALYDEKIKFIANIVASGLTDADRDYITYKKYLNVLGELDEVDMIHLKFYYFYNIFGVEDTRQEARDLYERHKNCIFSLQYYNIIKRPKELENERLNISLEVKSLSFHSTSKLLGLGLLIETPLGIPLYEEERLYTFSNEIIVSSFGKHLIEIIDSSTSTSTSTD